MSRRVPKSPPASTEVFRCLASLGVTLATLSGVQRYMDRHVGVAGLVAQIATDIRRSLPHMPLSLELVIDPEDADCETLTLYLHPQHLDSSIFNQARVWNDVIASRTEDSDAWFTVNVDLRGNN